MAKPDKDQIIQDILKLMELSSMDDEEKTMWKVLVPSMEITELEKFREILDKEVSAMTDLYLKALKK